MEFDLYIAELRGYLKALQRLTGTSSSFGVKHFMADEDVDIFINSKVVIWNKQDRLRYDGKVEIGYRELIESIKDFVFDGLLSPEAVQSENGLAYLQRTLIEDINEYYGLASSSLNSSGEFHPLVAGPVYKLRLIDAQKRNSLYFLVKIENRYVFTYFLKS